MVAKEAEIAEQKEAEANGDEEPTAAGAATTSKVKLNPNHHYLHGLRPAPVLRIASWRQQHPRDDGMRDR